MQPKDLKVQGRRKPTGIRVACFGFAALAVIYLALEGTHFANRSQQDPGINPDTNSFDALGLGTSMGSLFLPAQSEPSERVAAEPTLSGGATVSAFVWKQQSLTRAPNPAQAEYIVDAGRAELLEPFVADQFRRELEEELAEIEAALKGTAEVYTATVADVKASLRRSRSDRVLRLVRGVKETHADHVRIQETAQRVEGKTGAVWADMDPSTGDRLFYVVLWSEWPQLHDLLIDLGTLTESRKLILRIWITSKWHDVGFRCLTPG